MMKPVAFFRNTWKKKERRPTQTQDASRDPLPSPYIPNLPMARASYEPNSSTVYSARPSAEKFRGQPSQPRSPLPYSPPSSPRRFVEVEHPGGGRLLTPTSPNRSGGFFPYQIHSAGSSASNHDPASPSPQRPPRPPSLDLYSPVASQSSPSPSPAKQRRVDNDFELLDRFLDTYLDDSDMESDDELSTPKALGFSEGKVEKGHRVHGSHVVANSHIQDGRSGDHPVSPKRQRVPYKSGSTPHLRSTPSAPPASPPPQPNEDPLSLFPKPPPLIIRKKVPRPLVLRTMPSVGSLDQPSPSLSAFPPSPSIGSSSPDSTPLTTPTSPRGIPSPSVSRAPIMSANYMLKHATGRGQVHSPWSIPSPSTTHLPTPPTSPVAHDPMSSRLTLSRPPLRVAFSALNLRNEAYPAPTHRTTSSDSSPPQPSDRLQFNREYKAHSRLREEHRTAQVDSTESSESHVQWGYAI
ncbi:hypothetical protein BDN72DRAFT_361510 [Pluteus cervinus]|uniref:Uncharacterized protein n=1 Tax=Pluteus cervinus TaxID=181527 RepID=A0ACD3BE70_9AGAR|nr:hypothetical protein BDN72DRAFT_361510 [Pluteus cervinus]